MKNEFTFSGFFVALPRGVKRVIALIFDAMLLIVATWTAFFLRLGEIPHDGYQVVVPMFWGIVLSLPLFVRYGLYRAIFRYAGWPAIVTIAKAVAIYGVIYCCIFSIRGYANVPRTVGILQPLLVLLLVASSRILVQQWLTGTPRWLNSQTDEGAIMIYGAGSAGRQLASAITETRGMRLVGFLDDDRGIVGGTVMGLPVFAGSEVGHLVERFGLSDVLLAIPSCSRSRRAEIVSLLKELGLRVQTLPAVVDIARGKVSTNELHEVDIDDLLGRTPIEPDQRLMRKNIEGKVVLVTGAGGSIGQEICRQIIRCEPTTLLLLDASEFALYSIHQDLERLRGPRTTLMPIIATVRDRDRVFAVIDEWRPTTIFHAAAYKHVPLVESNIAEGILNNTFGTLNVAEAALANGVASFVLISTDKAVRPTNVMGATKRAAENILQALAARHDGTCFSMVRFGNVLGSSGSVVPLFRSQIVAGGPITLTHEEMTRYFMTIPEAAQLVIQAGAMARGGDVFVLDMGEPVRIIDLARNMVSLSGLKVRDHANPDGDIEVKVTGLRPGEKLYEELLIGDNPEPSPHPRIMRAHENFIEEPRLRALLNQLRDEVRAGDERSAKQTLMAIVPEFTSTIDLPAPRRRSVGVN